MMKKSILSFCAALALLNPLNAEIPAVAFKDVTRFFKDTHYSPLIGKAALQSGFIHNLRFLGKQGKQNVQGADHALHAPYNELLVYLFPSNGGELASQNLGDYTFGKHATIPAVAGMLKLAKEIRLIIKKHANSQQTIKEKYAENGESLQKALDRDNARKKTKLEGVVNKDFIKDAFCDAKQAGTLDCTNKQPVSSKFMQKLSGLQENILQCVEQEYAENAIYPEYTTEQFILGFFVRRFDSKEDIETLMRALGEDFVDIESFNTAHSLNPKWRQDLWGSDSELQDLEDLDSIFVLSYTDINAPVPYSVGSSALSYGSCPYVKLENGEKVVDTTMSFSDCKETALRHFFNIVFADSKLKTFIMHENLTPIPELKEFYQQQTWQEANNGSNRLRGQWNRVVSHIRGVSYNHGTNKLSSHRTNELSIGLKGFIKIIAHVLKLKNISTTNLSSAEDFVDTFTDIMKALKPGSTTGVTIDRLAEDAMGNSEVYGTVTFNIADQYGKTYDIQITFDAGHGLVDNINYEMSERQQNIAVPSTPLTGVMELINPQQIKTGLNLLLGQGVLKDDEQKIEALKEYIHHITEANKTVYEQVIRSLNNNAQPARSATIKMLIPYLEKGYLQNIGIDLISKDQKFNLTELHDFILYFVKHSVEAVYPNILIRITDILLSEQGYADILNRASEIYGALLQQRYQPAIDLVVPLVEKYISSSESQYRSLSRFFNRNFDINIILDYFIQNIADGILDDVDLILTLAPYTLDTMGASQKTLQLLDDLLKFYSTTDNQKYKNQKGYVFNTVYKMAAAGFYLKEGTYYRDGPTDTAPLKKNPNKPEVMGQKGKPLDVFKILLKNGFDVNKVKTRLEEARQMPQSPVNKKSFPKQVDEALAPYNNAISSG